MINIGLKRRVSGGKDRHGNPVNTWAEPVTVPVLGIAPASREEPREQGRFDAVYTVWTIYAPLGTEVGPYDRVVLPGGVETDVVGEVGVWSNNPHSLNQNHGGVVFSVQRRAG